MATRFDTPSPSSSTSRTSSSASEEPSPFSHLIPEVLAQVFEEYVFDNGQAPSFGSPTSPLKLSWISSHWREVAVNSSNLWRSLRFLPRRDTLQDAKENCPVALLTELWLIRSGSQPLQLIFQPNVRGRVELGQALWDVVCQYSSRWEDIDFFGCTFRPGLKLSIPPGGLTSLNACRLQEVSVYNKDLKPCLRDLLCSASNLRTFRFKGSILPWLERLGPNITSLSIIDMYTSTHPQVVRRVLQSLEDSLEVLSLNVSTWTPQWSQGRDSGHLILPKLKTLSLHTDGSAAPFFDMSILPALEEFEFYHDYAPANAPSFVSLFRRSQSPIRVLSLRNSQISAELMKECIELTNSTLMELHLHRAKGISASELCTILSSPNPSSECAKRLRRLSFTEPRTLDENEEISRTFLDVLRESIRRGSGLKYLHACVRGSEMKGLRKVVDTCSDVELKVGCSRRSICVCLQD